MQPHTQHTLVNLQPALAKKFGTVAGGMLAKMLEGALGAPKLNKLYAAYMVGELAHSNNFFNNCLNHMGVTYEVAEEDLAHIPKQGPLLVVANHPYGGIDGIVLGALLTSLRPETRLLANSLLGNIQPIRPSLIEVNPFGGTAAAKQNLRGIKTAIANLKAGMCVGTFPSGTVSHISWGTWNTLTQPTDPLWSAHTGRLARLSGASVVPVYFEGFNRWHFQLAGLVHPMLRTALLLREFLHKATKNNQQPIRLRIGPPIPPQRLKNFETDAALTEYLRLSTYILDSRTSTSASSPGSTEAPLAPGPKKRFPLKGMAKLPTKVGRKQALKRALEPVIAPTPPESLVQDIEALPTEQCLVQHNQYRIYYAHASQAPNVLREIARLREITFREVGEGTGAPQDTDRFDSYYLHLFMWDEQARCIAGAYRMGLTDRILEEHGPDGLYSKELFHFKAQAFDILRTGIELGRSFVVANYQRKHSTLVLMWRGILRYVALHPQYTHFYGAVSITNDYQSLSRNLMVQFLKNTRYNEALGPLVRAKNPPKTERKNRATASALKGTVNHVEDISALVSEIESDGKGIPILLKHYLKLNAKLASFNIDADFGDSLDGLIMVDMHTTNKKLMRQYMGAKDWKRYCAYHGIKS